MTAQLDHTIRQAREGVMASLDRGIQCPCCDQLAKRTRYQLSEKNIFLLAALYRCEVHNGLTGGVHIDTIAERANVKIKGGSSFSIMAWWGLIRTHYSEDPKKRTTGMWNITFKGSQFLKGKEKVPRYAYLYNGKTTLGGPQIGVREVGWRKFDYEEVMDWWRLAPS